MDDDFFRRDFDAPPRRDHLFAWTIFILLLVGVALACWIGSFYVFGHPERPQSYRILKKLHKVEAPKRFEITAGPPGEFLSAQKLYDRYLTFSRLQLQNENDELLRNYINNYQATKKLIPYVVGRFNILDSFELKSSDMFPSGMVALAQAADNPQVLIEHLYTSDEKNVPVLRKMLQTGLDVKLERTLDLAAVIHVERLANGSFQFTVVPLLYGSYALKQGQGVFRLDPPQDLNLTTGAPVIRGNLLEEALKTFADYKRKTGTESALNRIAPAAASPTPPGEQLVRLDPAPMADEVIEVKPKSTPRPLPTVAIAKASPAPPITTVALATPRPTAAIARITPPPIAPSIPTETPPAIAVASPPPALSPQGVQLTPFIQAAPAPNMAQATGGNWKVYPSGQMPRGRLVDPAEAPKLAETGVGGERLYLRGEFVVTASGESRAVLRVKGGLGNIVRPSQGATRVIVEFPAGINPPGEGASFSRDEARPFQVTDVRRGADGQINVYVREVTAP